jgi:hypothetical protein
MRHKTSTIHTTIATLQRTRLCVIYKQIEFKALNRPHFTCLGVIFQNIFNVMPYTLRELVARYLPRRLTRTARPNAIPTA